MPILLREDGAQFVIPSYRDILSTKQRSQLKRNILSLSENYGAYICLLRKGEVYELAFANEPGYLLGESIWHQLNRPLDMIYCEAIGNDEAIFVIVKAGSVYLDGKFNLDNITEELIILQTQPNTYDVFCFGDVPITKSNHANIIKSYNELNEPIFPQLILVNAFQLLPVAIALKQAQIGTISTQKILMITTIIIIAFGIYLTTRTSAPPVTQSSTIDIYANYYATLATPSVEDQLQECADVLTSMSHLPGWQMNQLHYRDRLISVDVSSLGDKVSGLNHWAQANQYQLTLARNGFSLVRQLNLTSRPALKKIYYINDVVGTLIDRLQTVYPGNNYNLAEINHKIGYSSVDMSIHVEKINSLVLALIAKQFKGLPVILNAAEFTINNDQSYSGNLNIQTLGD